MDHFSCAVSLSSHHEFSLVFTLIESIFEQDLCQHQVKTCTIPVFVLFVDALLVIHLCMYKHVASFSIRGCRWVFPLCSQQFSAVLRSKFLPSQMRTFGAILDRHGCVLVRVHSAACRIQLSFLSSHRHSASHPGL